MGNDLAVEVRYRLGRRNCQPKATTITNERLAQAGYFDMARKYKSLHSL